MRYRNFIDINARNQRVFGIILTAIH